jgi:prepilin-type N-terminal cleavage/methylation domain-containing protein
MEPPMISRALEASCPSRRAEGSGRPVRRGFTIVELLVAIGIIVLLAAILLPILNLSRRNAAITRIKSDLHAVGMALEAYKADFHKYPMRSIASERWILARALVGPANDDGHPGPGFRTMPGGRIWPPYLASDRFRVHEVSESPAGSNRWIMTPGSGQWAVMDSYDNPIQYYPRRGVRCADGSPVSALIDDYFSSSPGIPNCMFERTDGTVPIHSLRFLLGDANVDNQITLSPAPPETLRFAGDYILASPGPDQVWLNITPQDTTQQRQAKMVRLDDVFNFDY